MVVYIEKVVYCSIQRLTQGFKENITGINKSEFTTGIGDLKNDLNTLMGNYVRNL